MHILALGYWYWTTYWLQNCVTFFLVLKIPVWYFDGMALLSRLIPTLLTWFIPAFLLSMFYNTFSFSNSLSFSSWMANLLMFSVTLVFIHSLALLGVFSV